VRYVYWSSWLGGGPTAIRASVAWRLEPIAGSFAVAVEDPPGIPPSAEVLTVAKHLSTMS
jgi:hypothetical protein